MKTCGYVLLLLLAVGFFTASCAYADGTQDYLNNMFLQFVLLFTLLPAALGGMAVALVYRLRRWDFIIPILAMPFAYLVAMVAVFYVCLSKPDEYEPNAVWYYVAQAIVGWPFAIFALRRKQHILWNGLLASVIAATTAFGVSEIIERVLR